MKKALLLLCVVVVALFAAATASAKAGEGTDVFIGQGNWTKATNWSLGAKPTKTNSVVVPEGHSAYINKAGAETDDLILEGKIEGSFEVTAFGDLHITPTGDPDAKINLNGLGGIWSEGQNPYWIYIKGVHWLETDLNVETTLWVESYGTLRTHSHNVNVPVETYQANNSKLYLEGSTVTTGAFYIYPPNIETLEAQNSSLTVNRPNTFAEPGLNNSIMSCVGQQFGQLTLEGYGERTRGECKAHRLTMNQNFGGIGVEARSTVEPGALASNGTEELPAFVKSTTPGAPYTIKLSEDLTVEGCIEFQDAHVVGGTLTDPCPAGDGGGNEGIVF